ncbi:hypothetical protein J6590_105792, partial [Homalodisca vitripennis]
HRPCWNKEFRCDNGECIRPGELCDGHPDCQDLSDESNCSESDFVECGDGSKVHRYYWCDHWPECATSHLDDTNRSYYHNIYLQVTSWNVETEAKSTATTGVTSGLNVRRHTWTTPTDHIITIFIYSKVHRYYWCDQWPECATSHLDDTNRSYYHNIYLQVTSWNVEMEAKFTATTGVTSGLNVRRHTWTKPTDHISQYLFTAKHRYYWCNQWPECATSHLDDTNRSYYHNIYLQVTSWNVEMEAKHRYYWCNQWPECATSHLDDTNRSYYHNIYLQVTSWNVETEAKSTATTGVTSGLNVRRHTWTTPTDYIITIFIYR